MPQKVYPGIRPKRRIEKIVCRINSVIDPTRDELILHDAEDTKTLVRMMMDLYFTPTTTGTTVFSIAVGVKPFGTTVVDAVTAESLDTTPAEQELYRMLSSVEGTAGDKDHREIHVDSKAMRKLKVGDDIALSRQSVGNTVAIRGNIYLWFKE